MDKDVSAPVRWRDKSMAFGAREIFTHASKHGSLRCTSRPTQEAHYRERDGRREHRADWWTSRSRSLVRPAIYEISTLFWKVVGCQPAGSVLSALQTVRTAAGQPAHSAGLAPSELLKTFTLKQILLCSSTTRVALHDSQNTNSCLHHTEPRVKETHVLIHKIQSNACAHCLKVHV